MKILESFKLKNLILKNRVVMPPMCMYSSFEKNGKLNDFHFVHYLTRAQAGVGYIIIESTGITKSGRISDKDLGIWDDEFIVDFKKLVDKIHQFGSKTAIQINHAGRKSKVLPTVSSSDIAFGDYPKPSALNEDEIKDIIYAFGQAARRANQAGFDALEIHAAHGYLINQFVSPLANQRTDKYKDKTLFLKEVIHEILKYWPKNKVLQLRISAYEYQKDGLTPEIWSDIINELKNVIDIIHVSSGGTILTKVNDYPGYQIGYANTIKNLTNIPVIAGGLIDDITHGEAILKEDKADMIYYGRKLLRDPYFILRESNIDWPEQYVRAKNK